jgi:RNA polymerase sigma-70 factor (ECF subfamily)
MVTPSDHDLAQRARQGEAEAFGELVRRYQASVFNVCYRLMGERREAEDMAQEAFIRAYQRLERYDPSRPFGPWMRRVAANVCLNRLQSSQPPGLSLDDERIEPGSEQAPNPETARLRGERAEAVRQALASLPPHYRVVIELRHFQELSYEQISEELDIPLSDVKSHLFRARQSLAKKLRDYE